MKKKITIIILFAVASATSAFTINTYTNAGLTAASTTSQGRVAASQSGLSSSTASALKTSTLVNTGANALASPDRSVPQYVVYRNVFHQITKLKQQADEEERNGRDGSLYRSVFQREANLTDEHRRVLESIALACDAEVAQQDARARQIIDAGRAKHPGGRLQPGEKAPPPPAILATMQQERNAIIQRALDHLQKALSEEGFARLDSYVQRTITPTISAASVQALRPTLPPGANRQPEFRRSVPKH